MKVGCARTTLHIIHLHRVTGEIIEYRSVVFEYTIKPFIDFSLSFSGILCFVCCFKTIAQSGFNTVFNDFTCTEIDASIQR
jgi:hypothetical protein